MKIKPSRPFEDESQFEFFKDQFCDRCLKNEIPEMPCLILRLMKDSFVKPQFWPEAKIVSVHENDGRPVGDRVCLEFMTDNERLAMSYMGIFTDL